MPETTEQGAVERVARAAADHGVLYTVARGSACRCGWFGRDYVRHLTPALTAALSPAEVTR